MKLFECTYRKRGLPESPLKKVTVEANSVVEASYKVSRELGPEHVITRTIVKERMNGTEHLSE